MHPIVNEPCPANRKLVKARDGTAYTLQGPDNADTVVLIHGLGLNRLAWKSHLPELDQQYRVLNYDLYGHGDSPLPARPDLSLFSYQLHALMTELGIAKAILVGFSLGGMINRRFARDYPDQVQALVILNSPHERSPEAQKQVEQRALDSAAEGPEANLDATIDRWFTDRFQARYPDIIHTVRSWVLANNPSDYAQCRRVLVFGVKELIHPDPPISCPALIMTTEHDQGSTPAMARAIHAEIPDSVLRVVPGMKHMGLVESPRDFTGPILNFLQHRR